MPQFAITTKMPLNTDCARVLLRQKNSVRYRVIYFNLYTRKYLYMYTEEEEVVEVEYTTDRTNIWVRDLSYVDRDTSASSDDDDDCKSDVFVRLL